MAKLLGYKRVKGEKDGHSWDFVNLFIEKENLNCTAESGGTQLVTTFSKNRGTGFPSVDSAVFADLLRKGIRPGSDIRIYRDFDGTVIVELS